MQARDLLTDPRIAFRRDLAADILVSIEAGYEVLLLGDFNEAFASDDEGMLKMATTCGLLDLMTIRHSSTPPATYARGRTRLDYALATPHIAHAMTRAGYEPFQAKQFPSDHRPYYLDFDTAKLFGTNTQELGKPSDEFLSLKMLPKRRTTSS
jgi:endonuclease/exonuclease/phosphatase family metal-dependent hydrolase